MRERANTLCYITFENQNYPIVRVDMFCDACELSWLPSSLLDRNHDTYWSVANGIEGYFDRSSVLTIREIYDINFTDAGAAFGISAAQYQRYETGIDEVPRELGVLMRRALTEPEYFVDQLIAGWKRHGL